MMGLLDGILGSVLGGMQGGAQSGFPGLGHDNSQRGSGFPGGAMGGVAAAAPIIMMVMQMIQNNGGLGALLQKLTNAGHGDTAQTWVTPGAPNAPIDPSVLQQVFGQGAITDIAQKLGLSPQQAASGMAQALPGVVDQMTPDGTVPDNHGDMVSQVLAELKAMHR